MILLRGAEGDYARHPKLGGGKYDGLLLSTANGLAAPLRGILDALAAGRPEQARTLSERTEAVVDTVFEAATTVPQGNAFTNANKAIDHWMACGADAPDARAAVAAPRLHAGTRLPAALLEVARAALEREGLMPARGYLADR